MRTFEVRVSEPRPGCREIAIAGELDLAVAERVQEALDAVAGVDLVLIDLRECAFIDSTGIALIVRGHERVGEQGGRLAAFGPSNQVERVLQISGLTGKGLVFATADEAAAAGR